MVSPSWGGGEAEYPAVECVPIMFWAEEEYLGVYKVSP
jgi:hypothetical protein